MKKGELPSSAPQPGGKPDVFSLGVPHSVNVGAEQREDPRSSYLRLMREMDETRPIHLRFLTDEQRAELQAERERQQAGELASRSLLPFGHENEWAEANAARQIARDEVGGREPTSEEVQQVLKRYGLLRQTDKEALRDGPWYEKQSGSDTPHE